MAGASDPGIATALAAQSKQIDSQTKNITAQSKILQQLCERLEAHDHRWRSLEKSVAAHSDDIAVLHVKLDDAAIDSFRVDLQHSMENRWQTQVAEMEAAS
jgi:RNA binding exosome subunit